MSSPEGPSRRSIRRHLMVGAVAAAVLIVGFAGWAGTAKLAGPVIAHGLVVVDSEVKKVQHPTGGIVGELNVRNDQLVKAGDVVVRLDETQTKANLAVYTKSLDELYARQARLETEKDGAETIKFPQDLLAREAGDAQVAHILEGERKLFLLRLEARSGEKAQLHKRVDQLKEQVSGLTEQIEAKGQEIALIEEELKGVLELWKKQLIQLTRVNSLNGERGHLIAAKAEAGGKITEVELQII
jgi:HlyD family secretion protein